jgi:hypothetical protein
MIDLKRLGIAGLCAVVLTASAQAETITSRAGARASVSGRYAGQFQALVNDLEAHGATVKFMGGYRAGRCGQATKHPCGMALDVCQLARGVVDRRCNLPGRAEMSEIAKAHGLFSGGDWCNSDYGHVEAGGSVACGHRWTGREEATAR